MAINAALAVSAALGLTSTMAGAFQTLGGKEKQREAEKASAKYASEIEKLRARNLMEGVAIPMRGFDLAKEAQAQRYATGVAALQSAGAEGVLGGLTRLERQQGQQDLALAAQLEKMEYARNLERARQAQNIENQAIARQAQLNFMRLQGAGQAAAEGARQQQAGIQSIIGGLGTAAELGLKYAPLYGDNGADTGSGTMIDIGGDTSQISRVGRQAPITPQEQYIQMRQGDTGNVMDTSALVPGATAVNDFYGQHSRFPKVSTGATFIGGFGDMQGINALSATGHLVETPFNPSGYVNPFRQENPFYDSYNK